MVFNSRVVFELEHDAKSAKKESEVINGMRTSMSDRHTDEVHVDMIR